MTQVPNFNAIAQALRQAEPLEMYIEPFRAFSLVGQLQLALRHPGNKGVSAEVVKEMAMRLQARLSQIDPAIAEALEHGWNPELDVSDEEFEQAMRTGEYPKREAVSPETARTSDFLGFHAVALDIAVELIAEASSRVTKEGWLALVVAKAIARCQEIEADELNAILHRNLKAMGVEISEDNQLVEVREVG